MLKIVIHVAFAIIASSYLIWSSVNAEETLSATQSPEAVEGESTQPFLSSASDSHFEKDFSASVGVKMWMNQWNLPDANTTTSGSRFITSYTSATETTLIPVLSVRTKNWLVSGSYFTKTEYDFEKQSADLLFFNVGIPHMNISLTNERTEWDINTGYYLHKYLLVTAGYKGIKRTLEITSGVPGSPATKISIDSKSSGPTLGVASVVPLQGRLGLYGNFAYGRLDTTEEIAGVTATGEATTIPHNTTADYYLGEMGLFYSFKIAKVIDAATVSLGYRFQSLYYKGINELEMRDGTEGFALTLTASF